LRRVHPPSRDPSPGDQPPGDDLDLDVTAAELADVEVAMERIQSGTYWTDEVTGEPIPDEQLAANPTTRRAMAETDDPALEFTEMADVLADLDAAGDAAELDVAELDALADAEFLAELGRLDGEQADDVEDPDDVDDPRDVDGADDLEVELVVDEVPDPPADPPAR
jgi:hypothetical protein